MNPVVSYNDFLDFLKSPKYNQDRLIPVLLIKPSTINYYYNQRIPLDRIFDYFDARTGDHIQFFLPGYAHYPDNISLDTLSQLYTYNENCVALNIRRLGKIYYSNKDFVKFIEELEKHALNFRYQGDTELLFIKYIANTQNEPGHFDFSQVYRFNLSNIFYCRCNAQNEHARFQNVERFLELVIHTICIVGNKEDKLIRSIEAYYNGEGYL